MPKDKLVSFGGQMQPLTASAIANLAFTKIFEKTLEKFTEAALIKVNQLRQKIADKLRGNPKAEVALAKVEKGSQQDLETVAALLEVEMKQDQLFAQDIDKLAQEIQQEINIGKVQGQNVQSVYGGEAYQNNDSKASIFQGSGNTFHLYNTPPS